jgi:hypothetical protein
MALRGGGRIQRGEQGIEVALDDCSAQRAELGDKAGRAPQV